MPCGTSSLSKIRLRGSGRLTARIYIGDDEMPGCNIRTGLGDEMLKFGFYKSYMDGNLSGRTAFMLEPYSDDPSTCGCGSSW